MAKKTVMKFDQFGNISIDQTGFTGKACAETTAKLIKGLSAESTTDDKKPEFNQFVGTGTANQEKQRSW